MTSAGFDYPSLTVASGHLDLPWYGCRQHGHYLPPCRMSYPQMAAGYSFSLGIANQSVRARQNIKVTD